jgi:tRNA pseudouridine32 synthase/23S rRNA pseudouridine746 synthase
MIAAGIQCLFQNQHIYALFKPPGMPFHNTASTATDALNTLAYEEGVVAQAKHLLNDEHVFPVHRLDKMTSGLMVFARHADANRTLSMALQARQIEKYYLALSLAKPKKKQGAVIGDMQKSRSGSYKLSRTSDNPAVTRFFASAVSQDADKPLWLFALKPETGKTHQLRVAMKALGSPVLGDQRYGGAKASRGYLHAYRMRFDLYGERYDLTAPDFQGSEFHLDSLSNTDMPVNSLLSPENLPWPKAAFKLK